MNKERLKIARDYLKNHVKPEMFYQGVYRDESDFISYNCKTIGCAIGHLTVLDDKFKTDPNYFRDRDGEILFKDWGIYYFELTELEYLFISDPEFSNFLFDYTGKQQLDHSIERIDYLRIHGKVPDGFNSYRDCEGFPLGFSKKKKIVELV